MKRSVLTLVAGAALAFAGACSTGDNGADSTIADTTTMPGQDTVQVPTTVPTTDTMITTKQIETDTTVRRGDATDTTRRNP